MSTRSCNLLVIDDDPDIVELIKETLASVEGIKFAVNVSDNGQMGYVKAKELKPDLIILDVVMPRWNGFQTYEKLKSFDDTSKIPVIFLTAAHEKADIEKAVKLGVKHYLTKPFQPENLVKKVKEVLGN
jgi:DNA-binding response OmpR family regulator